MKNAGIICFWALVCFAAACKAPSKALLISQQPLKQLGDSIGGAHLGVLVVEAHTGKRLAEWNGHKYFVPASNTKLLSMYAGLKYLPDSLPALRYYDSGDTVFVQPTGDPTFLHSGFNSQPVVDWLLKSRKPMVVDGANWKAERYGPGWAWGDYQATYQPERSALPVFGNLAPVQYRSWAHSPSNKPDSFVILRELTIGPMGGYAIMLQPDWWKACPAADGRFRLTRDYASNGFVVQYPSDKDTTIITEMPLATNGNGLAIQALMKLLRRGGDSLGVYVGEGRLNLVTGQTFAVVKSQPLDSMLKPMMHRSDNFFAEQTLLMASNQLLGYMGDRDMIDTMMKTDFKDMPDKPVWADGSGLSRYNLQTPANFVWLLDKLRREFPMERLKAILPSGNQGTLANYYTTLNGKLFAKTGTLSGQVALSGYLYAKSGKLLLFSVLVNNHNTEAARVRRQVERFLTGVWEAN